MDIKDLEQEDCVSREFMYALGATCIATRDKNDKLIAIAAIENLPSATRKKGKWVKVRNGRGGHECNICQMYAPSYQSGDEYLSRFCPNCGIEMELSELLLLTVE